MCYILNYVILTSFMENINDLLFVPNIGPIKTDMNVEVPKNGLASSV